MKTPSDITAVILAGGFWTRLRKVVSDRPKIISDVCERPFLSYLFDQLESGGFKHVVLCLGYMGELVREVFGSNYGSLRLFYSQETEHLERQGPFVWRCPFLSQSPF